MLLISLLIIKIYTGAPNSTNDNLYSTLLQKPMKKNPCSLTLKSAQFLWTTIIYLFVYLLLINIDCL